MNKLVKTQTLFKYPFDQDRLAIKAAIMVEAQLLRLFQADESFVIGDPTEMPRPRARKTDYACQLKDGKTRGSWLLLLPTSFRGRAISRGFVIYSSCRPAFGCRTAGPSAAPVSGKPVNGSPGAAGRARPRPSPWSQGAG